MRTSSFLAGLALLVTGTAIGVTSQHLASADVSSGDRPILRSITPCRLADTRTGTNTVGPRSTPLGPAATITVDAQEADTPCTGTIPTDAIALSLNITALNATAQSFLTIWADGDRPLAASLNPAPGQPPVPNAVTTQLSATQGFEVYNDAGNVNVVVDVNGYYVNHDHDDRYSTDPGVAALTRTVIVPGDGTPEENGEAYDQAAEFVKDQNPTAADPWLIKLEPGEFAITGGVAPANVRIEGSGREVTRLTCSGATCRVFDTAGELSIAALTATATSLPAVRARHAVLLDDVALVAAPPASVAMHVSNGGAAIVERSIISNRSDGPGAGDGVNLDGGFLRLVDSDVIARGTLVVGIRVQDARLEVSQSRFETEATSIFSCCQAGESSTIEISHSSLSSSDDEAIVANSADIDMTIEHSAIEHGSSFGTAISIGATDGTHTLTVIESSIHGSITRPFGDPPSTVVVRSSFVDGAVAATVKQCRGVTTSTGFFEATCP